MAQKEESDDDLSFEEKDFDVSKHTRVFFHNLSSFAACKKKLDELYINSVQSPGRVLQDLKYKSRSPYTGLKQEGSDATTVEELRVDAAIKKPVFDDLLRTIVKDIMKADPDEEIKVGGEPIRNGSITYKHLTLADIKSEARCREKAENEYKNDPRYLCDIGRATIVCYTEEEAARAIDAIEECEQIVIVRIKNRIEQPNPIYFGIRDILMNVEVYGHIFELQIKLAPMLAGNVMGRMHIYYEFFRKYFAGESESCVKRMKIFEHLEEAFENNVFISDALKEILEGTDVEKLFWLGELASKDVFYDPDLRKRVWKRLLQLCDGPAAAVFREYADVGIKGGRLLCLFEIADAYREQGAYSKAANLYERVLEGQDSTLGINRKLTLATINGLALVRNSQGKYQLARELFEKCLEFLNFDRFINDRTILAAKYNLATTYIAQSDYCSANELLEEVYEKRKALLGENHPDTLASLHELAGIYRRQDNYDKAMELYEVTLTGRKTSLGINHPSTLETIFSMALIHNDRGECDRAMELYKETLNDQQAVLGTSHPQTLQTMDTMASSFGDQENYDISTELYKEVLDRRILALGDYHPHTLLTKHNLGVMYHCQEKYSKALDIFQDVLTGWKSAFDNDHPHVSLAVEWITEACDEQEKQASVQADKENYNFAIELYQKVLEAKKLVLGKGDLGTLKTMNNLAVVYNCQELYREAFDLFQEVHKGWKLVLGDNHPDTLSAIEWIEEVSDELEKQSKNHTGETLSLGLTEPRINESEDVLPIASVVVIESDINDKPELYYCVDLDVDQSEIEVNLVPPIWVSSGPQTTLQAT